MLIIELCAGVMSGIVRPYTYVDDSQGCSEPTRAFLLSDPRLEPKTSLVKTLTAPTLLLKGSLYVLCRSETMDFFAECSGAAR